MKFFVLIGFVACLIFSSCSQKKSKINIPQATVFAQSPMDSVYSELRPEIQIFKIDNSISNTIKAKNGTQVFIPSGSFVNADGEIVKDAEIEIAEASSLSDFISSGLATVLGDKLLISNGMMYINAKAGKEMLTLDKGKSLTVSMPVKGNDAGFQMFTGNGKQWTVDSSMTATDYAIPLPLDLLYPEGNKFHLHFSSTTGYNPTEYFFLDTNIVSATNKKYENTFIATKDFQDRYWSLRGMTEWMSILINNKYYLGSGNLEDEKFNYDLFRLYYDHPLRSLKNLIQSQKKCI